MKLKQVVPWIVVAVIVVFVLSTWLTKPYSSIQLLDANTKTGRQHIVIYTLSKCFSHRKKLTGNDPYKLYLYANDPDGIKSLLFFVNGKQVKTLFEPGETFEEEFNGLTKYGLHTYKMIVEDNLGNRSTAEAYINISVPGGVSI